MEAAADSDSLHPIIALHKCNLLIVLENVIMQYCMALHILCAGSITLFERVYSTKVGILE